MSEIRAIGPIFYRGSSFIARIAAASFSFFSQKRKDTAESRKQLQEI